MQHYTRNRDLHFLLFYERACQILSMACVIFVIWRKSSFFRFFLTTISGVLISFLFFSSLYFRFFDVRNILCVRKIWMINEVYVWHFSSLLRGEAIRNSLRLPLPRILVYSLVFLIRKYETLVGLPVLAVVEQPARKRARDVKIEYPSMLSLPLFFALT